MSVYLCEPKFIHSLLWFVFFSIHVFANYMHNYASQRESNIQMSTSHRPSGGYMNTRSCGTSYSYLSTLASSNTATKLFIYSLIWRYWFHYGNLRSLSWQKSLSLLSVYSLMIWEWWTRQINSSPFFLINSVRIL